MVDVAQVDKLTTVCSALQRYAQAFLMDSRGDSFLDLLTPVSWFPFGFGGWALWRWGLFIMYHYEPHTITFSKVEESTSSNATG